jgi:hypothetical protein
MEPIDRGDSLSIRCVDTVLYSGISALLISAAHLRPELWFISLVALIPFLWRAARGSFVEIICLGCALAASCFLIMEGSAMWMTPASLLLKLLVLSFLFVLYGTLVNRISKHVGFNAIFIAVFWLPVEYALNHNAHMNGMFSFSGTSSTLLARVSSFFGALMISFLVVFINSVLLIASKRFVRAIWFYEKSRMPCKREESFFPSVKNFIKKHVWYNSLSARAPPLPILLEVSTTKSSSSV